MLRLNLTLSNSVNARLERLQITCDSATKTEVVRRALATYELLVELPEGTEIQVVSKEGEVRKILLTP